MTQPPPLFPPATQTDRLPSSTDVAKRAGVSQSTVSRVFSSGANVSSLVKERVLRAAAELNYRPNALPGILQTGRSGIVALIVGGLYNPFFSRFLEQLSAALRERGLQVMLVQADSDSALDEVVADIARYRVDAVFSALGIRSKDVAKQLNSYQIPIVTINSKIEGGYIGSVSSNNVEAGAQAARLLMERGCVQLAYIAGRDSDPQNDRQAGFMAEAKRLKLPAPVTALGGFSYEEGYAGALALAASAGKIDGLFCVNDLVALGAIDAIENVWNLMVPTDIQVIGFDNIPMSAWAAHQLTTFDQSIEALVASALELVQQLPNAHKITVPVKLIERRTTAP